MHQGCSQMSGRRHPRSSLWRAALPKTTSKVLHFLCLSCCCSPQPHRTMHDNDCNDHPKQCRARHKRQAGLEMSLQTLGHLYANVPSNAEDVLCMGWDGM